MLGSHSEIQGYRMRGGRGRAKPGAPIWTYFLLPRMLITVLRVSSTLSAMPDVPLARLNEQGRAWVLREQGLHRPVSKRIVIVDGYVSEKVLDLLTAKKPGVTVEIMMKPSQSDLIFDPRAGRIGPR